MNKLTKAILVSSLALMAALVGCKTGMFAPRSGQLFQTTRMCPGPGSLVYTAPLMMGVWGVQKCGGEWTIPIGIVGIPIAAAGFVVDECVVSPLVDLVCLPYDLYSSLPNLPQLVEELVSVPWGQHRQRKGAPQKERSMDALTSSTDAGPIAAVVDSLLCGLVGKIVARLEEIASGFWAMSSTGRALGVACVI